jgi:ADP-heptose:LPS heptosyltransferase
MTTNVLYVRPDGLGDVVLAGPAIRAVAASGADVTLLCGPAGVPVGHRLPGVSAVMEARLGWIDAEPRPITRRGTEALVEAIASRTFDAAVVGTSFHQSPLPTALVLRMAGVPTIGAISVDYPGALLDVRHHVEDDLHEVERALSLVSAMGYRLPADDSDALQLRDAPARTSEGYVVVHPGASVPARTWAPQRWRAVVDTLVRRGYRPVVTGGDTERELTAYVAGCDARAREAGGLHDLDTLLGIIAGADAIVVGNTGPAHLAAALGTPVVSVFAPTVPAWAWRPWRVPHVVLGDQSIACAGCRARECPVPGHPCIGSVRTDDVVVALRWLDRAARRDPVPDATPGRVA